MNNESGSDSNEQWNESKVILLIAELRRRAFRQIVFGLLWWLGSALAMYMALSSTGGTIYYWYGGALGSLFHWFRAYKLISATQKLGAKPLIKREAILVGLVLVVVGFTSSQIIPEYIRVDSPDVGTCWAQDGPNGSQYMLPIACWSSKVVARTVGFSDTPDSCPDEATSYLEPDYLEPRTTCLVDY